ncbi:uncharacterized protein zmp:0000000951 [Tachysurus vachellii]|uniref:uncharacterized protein zmp:0000000951 n=1 Tax=Tachysurus vachellii TaxID=175792 RepID=UPI00296B28EC|nr:uncharacterized protein zmp:0000000951 [Tachysurus vachellii]
MERKLPEDQIKSVLAQWRFSWQSSGFKDRLVTALELYEHFPLDIAVTGGTKSANARLASVVCGLKEKQEEEEEEEEEETDVYEDSDEQEDEDEEDDGSSIKPSVKVCVEKKSLMKFTDNFAEDSPGSSEVLFHPQIPNVRVFTVQRCSSPSQDSYDILVVLTTELHQEDHMRLTMEQCEKNKSLYLVKAEQEMDLVREKLDGPCKTCAWERMRARTVEFQKKHKVEFESAENTKHQQTSQGPFPLGIKLWELEEIAEVLVKAIPQLRKKAFTKFLVDLTSEHRGSLENPAFKNSKMSQEDLDRISVVFQSQDLTDQPSKLLSIFNTLEHFRLDVGLLGETGCGSSSLFNSFLGLKNGDKGASPVGVFETTKTPVTYPYSEYHNVLLWDLPGLGHTEDFTTASSSNFTLHHVPPIPSIPPCDVYFVVSPLRLNLGYIQLLKHLLSKGKSCYIVLSKADLIEEKLVEEVRRWNEEILDKLGLKQNVYLVSALHPDTLDLPKMRRTFNDALENHKKVALANYLTNLLEQDVFWKRADHCKIN